jgi:hypothetical protein
MAKEYGSGDINELRRKDRQKDDEFIKSFLKTSAYCSIANVNDGQPFIHSNVFVYDEESHAIYFHTAAEGRFRFNIENNSKVSFTISEMGRLLPAKRAINMSVEYKSVVVFGKVSVIEDESEAEKFLRILTEKYFPHLTYGKDYNAITESELKLTTTYKLEIEKWSGKEKKADDDFEGAFYYFEKVK